MPNLLLLAEKWKRYFLKKKEHEEFFITDLRTLNLEVT
jgi:hypothetical protein